MIKRIQILNIRGGEGGSKQEYLNKLTENLHKAADEDIAKTNAEKKDGWHLDPKWQEGIMNAGRYSMAAAIGLAAGLGTVRFGMLAAEHRADRMAVQITGKPEALKNTLSAMGEDLKKLLGRQKQEIAHLKKHGYTPTLKKRIMDIYQEHILIPHPSDAERIKVIDSFAERLSMQQNSGFSAARA